MAAAAAGTALLRSIATKMGMAVAPRAPSLHRHPLLLDGLRGRRSGLTSSRHHSSSSSAPSGPPPPTNNKDLTPNNNVPSELHSGKVAVSRPAAYMACFVMFGAGAFMIFWAKPRIEELRNELSALRRERSTLIKALEECQRTHCKAQDMLADSSQAQSIQALEQANKVIGGQQAS